MFQLKVGPESEKAEDNWSTLIGSRCPGSQVAVILSPFWRCWRLHLGPVVVKSDEQELSITGKRGLSHVIPGLQLE